MKRKLFLAGVIASFLALASALNGPVNAQIGIGRTDSELTLSGQLSISDGTAGDPSIVFTSDDDGSGTGIYRSAANGIAFTLNGVQWAVMLNNSFRLANAGVATAPAIILTGDTDTGMYWPSANNLGFAAKGALVMRVGPTNVAGAGADLVLLNPTLGIMDATGSDTVHVIKVDIVNADHTGGVIAAFDADIDTADPDSTEAAYAADSPFDIGFWLAGTNQLTVAGQTTRGVFINWTNAAHTGGNVNALEVGSITGDADADEVALNIGTGWDTSIYLADNAGILFEGATANTEELTLSVVDPTADITVQFRDDKAATYNILVTPNADVTVGDFLNPLIQIQDGVAASANTTDDVLLVQRFYLPHPLTVITVDLINIDSANASAGDNTIAVALYEDLDGGTQIVEAIGASDDGAGGFNGAYSINITDTTFEPGWYRIAFCAQDVSDNDIVIQTANGNIELVLGAGTGEFLGQGANPCVAGDPPATTGAISQADGELVPFLLTTN